MRIVNAIDNKIIIEIGRQGENKITDVRFDISGWEEEYGSGAYELLHQRPSDSDFYPCVVTHEDNYVSWIIKAADVAKSGKGRCQLTYIVNQQIAKSVIFYTSVLPSMTGGEDVPEPYKDWVNAVLEAGEEAVASAQKAAISETNAKQSENNANVSATNAEVSAQRAAESASDAESAASSAAQSSSEASSSASNAENAANTAEIARSAAMISAGNAASSESSASDSASVASIKATEASASATEAASSAGDAETSSTAAETAKNVAVAAKETAVSAKDIAVSAKDAAVSARTSAENAAGSATSKAAEAAASAETAALKAAETSASASSAATSAMDASASAERAESAALELETTVEQVAEHTQQITGLIAGDATEKSARKKEDKRIWDYLQGIAYDFETDETTAYAKTVPQGIVAPGNMAGIHYFCGKSLVWNQLASDYGIVTLSSTKGLVAGTAFVEGHKYYMTANASGDSWAISVYARINNTSTKLFGVSQNKTSLIETSNYSAISDGTVSAAGHEGNCWVYYNLTNAAASNLRIVDLSQLFGIGNEPTELTDDSIKFIEAYLIQHSEYNSGKIISARVAIINSQGRNLLNAETSPNSGETAWTITTRANTGFRVTNKDGSSWRNGWFSVQLKAGDYVLSYTDSWSWNTLRWLQIDIDGTIIFNSSVSAINNRITHTFSVPHDGTVKIYLYASASGNISYTVGSFVDYSNIQIERGSLATSYLPYWIGDSCVIPAPLLEFLEDKHYGIGIDTENNVLDFERKKYIKYVGKRVFDGSETWTDNGHIDGTSRFFTSALSDKAFGIWNILCDRFITRNAGPEYICGRTASVGIEISILDNRLSTTDIAGFKSWLAENNVTVQYELAEPIEYDISGYLSEFEPFVEVESGGSLTFEQANDTELPVPSKETYLIKIQPSA